MDNSFLFLRWVSDKYLTAFHKKHIKDLNDHDKCGACGFWVITQSIDCEDDYTCLWQCPNCKAVDKF